MYSAEICNGLLVQNNYRYMSGLLEHACAVLQVTRTCTSRETPNKGKRASITINGPNKNPYNYCKKIVPVLHAVTLTSCDNILIAICMLIRKFMNDESAGNLYSIRKLRTKVPHTSGS